MADQQQGSAEIVERRVERMPGVGVEVVGRLVEQQHIGPLEELRRQAEGDDLAPGQRFETTVETDVREPQPVQLGAGAFFDVPVVADRGEDRVTGIPAGQRVQCGDHRGGR